MILLTEYLAAHDLYLVVPILDGHPSQDTEFLFSNELDQLEFIRFYMKNPTAAHFSYEARMQGMAELDQSKMFYDMTGAGYYE